MKVVLFCGGLGTRLWDYTRDVPKPMVEIGYRPLLWYVMKYYAYHGHRDFILCLGYKADVVKRYFLDYHEGISNDFVLTSGGKDIELLNTDIEDWRITFVDTGMNASIGERLAAVRPLLEGEETFLANYSDGLTDAPLPQLIERHQSTEATVTLLMARPTGTYHVVDHDDELITGFEHITATDRWVNGGFYVMNQRIFDYLHPGEDLVAEPFERLIKDRALIGYKYDGFWTAMDTFKDKQRLEDLYAQGSAPWLVWKDE